MQNKSIKNVEKWVKIVLKYEKNCLVITNLEKKCVKREEKWLGIMKNPRKMDKYFANMEKNRSKHRMFRKNLKKLGKKFLKID